MYDVIVIGGGPGGYRTAELCGKRGLSVALIEREYWGGTCLNQGCIPFKTYLHTARIRSEAKKIMEMDLFGKAGLPVNLDKLLGYKDIIVSSLQRSVMGLLRSCGVDLYDGNGSVVEIDAEHAIIDTGSDRIEGKNLVIATGSEEKRISISGDFPYKVFYSNEMLKQDSIPDTIDIIGGGVIGMEAASFYADCGCKVTIFEGTDHLGGNIDREIAGTIEQVFDKKGIMVKTNTLLKEITSDGVIFENCGITELRQPQCILVAIGRTPCLDNEALDKWCISYDKNGIIIDESCRTNLNNVYACGDVTGKMMLAHTAYRQAKVIADTICGRESTVEYDCIPRVIYTNPEILSVGLCENDCDGVQYTSKSLPMTYSGKYYAENGKDGAKAKMLVNDNNQIIGFHMIGNGASEIALAAEMMVLSRMRIEDIQNLVFAHPTYGEIISELAGLF